MKRKRIASATDIAIMLEKDTNYTPPNKEDLVNFFKMNPSFDLGTDSIEEYIKYKPESFDNVSDVKSTKELIKKIQRIYKIAPTYEQMSILMQDNLDSAQSISNIGRNVFVGKYAKSFGDKEIAWIVYDNALRVIANENALQISEKPVVFFASFTFICR
jgi:hypothetical protein